MPYDLPLGLAMTMRIPMRRLRSTSCKMFLARGGACSKVPDRRATGISQVFLGPRLDRNIDARGSVGKSTSQADNPMRLSIWRVVDLPQSRCYVGSRSINENVCHITCLR